MNTSVTRGITARTSPRVWAFMCYVFIIVAAMALATPDAFAKDKGLYKVNGKVTNMITGKKIKGATVTLTSASGTETLTTNKKGKYKSKVPPGQYKIEISYPDYISQSKDIDVTDASVVVDAALVPTSSVGTPGADGKSAFDIAVDNGFAGTEEEWLMDQLGVGPEVCVQCHNGEVARNGVTHQEQYAELFQQDVIVVSDINYANDGTNDTVTFQLKKNDISFDCTEADALSIGFSQYVAAERRFLGPENGEGVGSRVTIGSLSTISYDPATNVCTSVNAQSAFGDLSAVEGILVVYGEDEQVDFGEEIGHIRLAKYPFAGLKETAGAVDYQSAANVTGCENCHQTPYYKHGYIRGDISAGGGLDFYACKVCHIDNGPGHDWNWQISVDNPQRWAELFLNTETPTPAEQAQYAYKTRLMNDVHMSHSMEFPYPQPIRTCATCHEGKLQQTLTDDNFTLETCLSCHPVTGGTDTANSVGDFTVDTRDMALKGIWEKAGVLSFHLQGDGSVTARPCNSCHKAVADGGIAPVFSALHTGYDPRIYYKDADGNYQHYRDAITASIDSVTLSDNVLDIRFSASGTAGGLSADDVVPTVQVAFYGYDTKDFILSNHTKNANGDRMEKTMGTDNALFTEVTNEPGNWEVTLDMAAYAAGPEDRDIVADIASGVIKKAEVIVRPLLNNAAGDSVGLNAVSKTVDVTADGTDAFVPNYFQGVDAPGTQPREGNALVKVEQVDSPEGKSGCNSCHDQLAITFHSGDRGGNIVVCRSCHVVTSGGSHLQGQSRSIDSYVHAIHRFQAFNVDEIDFNDPVEKAKYDEHVEFLFPDFAAINCERCHTDERVVDNGMRGTFDIPDQSKSMPGVLSATDESPGISDTPAVIVGPAARACGGCHRAAFINKGDAGGYVTFNEHTKRFGYRVEVDTDNTAGTNAMLNMIIDYIMGLFP
jgi:OmcA/MtrC family decaheme c-type cytochrome